MGIKDNEPVTQFIPVSSFIYTLDFVDTKRRFNSTDSINIDNFYGNRDFLGKNQAVNDSTNYQSLKNTAGLSLREGFSPWAKFDLTAFISQNMRKYTMMDTAALGSIDYNQSSTSIGGEIAKRTGKILRYEAQGELGVLGYNSGDFSIIGKVETRIPVFKDTASVTLNGSIKNMKPTLYENHFHGKYFWWDNDFEKVKKVYLGGTIDIPQTNTQLSLGVENLYNYIYFDETGNPDQYSSNIQVLGVTLTQNFKLGGFHLDNQLVYQTSSDQDRLPLPDLGLYSSLYFQFKISKVLTVQLGGDLRYFSKYYAPGYEPVTQQFRLQKDVKIGDYPFINAFINCHLKQARFFVEFYNLSDAFTSNPNYFSVPHYPLNPMIFKLGISTYFIN